MNYFYFELTKSLLFCENSEIFWKITHLLKFKNIIVLLIFQTCLCEKKYWNIIVNNCIPGQSQGYLGLSMVAPPPLQRFLLDALPRKIFYSAFSNLVCGYIWGRTLSPSFCGIGLQQIGQWRPYKGQNLGFWTHFSKVLKDRRVDE